MPNKEIPKITLFEILDDGFSLDVTQWSDEPIDPARDKVLYTDPATGRSIIARAPLIPQA